MRLVASIALMEQAIVGLLGRHPINSMILGVLTLSVAILILLGLWTPIAGALAIFAELLNFFSHAGDMWTYILLGTFGAALALLGPGAWSADARLFGWKRINI